MRASIRVQDDTIVVLVPRSRVGVIYEKVPRYTNPALNITSTSTWGLGVGTWEERLFLVFHTLYIALRF